MRTRTLLAVAVLSGLLAVATRAGAAAFFIPVHDFRLGTCADGSACQWDCAQERAECADGSECRIDAETSLRTA